MKPPVLLAYVLIGLAAYYLGVSRSSEEIGVKNERISFLNDQISAYKDRLQGATPDQAAKQIAELQNSLNEYKKEFEAIFPSSPRSLKKEQEIILIAHKDAILKFGKPLHIYSGTAGDSISYAQNFADFFKSQDIPITGPTQFGCQAGVRGVLVGMKDPSKPSENANLFLKILGDAGLHPNIADWQIAAPDELDFDLYICPPY
jgi:hypothetical protein